MIVDMDTHVNISDYESSLPLCDLYELMDDDYRENLLPFVSHFERTDSEGRRRCIISRSSHRYRCIQVLRL